jgi:hypothetical protein
MFDIPKSKITHVGRYVILDMDFPEIYNYKVDREAMLPSGESVEKIAAMVSCPPVTSVMNLQVVYNVLDLSKANL